MHKWYKINASKIIENNKWALCNDQVTHMVPIPPTEPPEINAFTTIAKLTFLQTQNVQISNTDKQPMYSNLTSAN